MKAQRGHALRIGQNHLREADRFGIDLVGRDLAQVGDACVLGIGQPDVQIEPERPGDLVAEIRAEAAAGDAAHHLADQPAEGDARGSRARCRAPTTAPAPASAAHIASQS